jgi:hypothetical protein
MSPQVARLIAMSPQVARLISNVAPGGLGLLGLFRDIRVSRVIKLI